MSANHFLNDAFVSWIDFPSEFDSQFQDFVVHQVYGPFSFVSDGLKTTYWPKSKQRFTFPD